MATRAEVALVELVRAGLATSIQDLGRAGLAALGVTEAGALDAGAMRLANRLVGNPERAAGLETCGGLLLRPSTDVLVAVTGADAPIDADGRPVACAAPVVVAGGAHLAVGLPRQGLRCYVAVRGGFDVPEVLGSRSWDSLGRLGPTPPVDGDLLRVGADPRTPVSVDVAPPRPPVGSVRIWPGPRLDWFDPATPEALASAAWTVRADSDRVGVRLDGPSLRRSVSAELASEGMVAGAIQVPHDGRPIVMLADHPTTGGYPVVAVVDPDDLGAVAQVPPGEQLRFRWARRTGGRR